MAGRRSVRRLHSFLVLALALPSLSQTAKPDENKATVRVQVITEAEEVLANPRIVLLTEGKKVAVFRNSMASAIPYGDYLLRVEEPGFRVHVQKMSIRDPLVRLTVRIIVAMNPHTVPIP